MPGQIRGEGSVLAADSAAKSGAGEALIAQPHQVANVWLNKKVFEGERDMAKHVAKEISDMRKLGLLTTHSLPPTPLTYRMDRSAQITRRSSPVALVERSGRRWSSGPAKRGRRLQA